VEESSQNQKFAKSAFLVSVLVGILFISNSREENKADGWKTYRDKEQHFEIKYPAKLIRISKENQQLKLLHSIPFEHPNPCYFGDGPSPPLLELTDFRVTIEVLGKNLKGAVVQYEGATGEYFLTRFVSDSVLKIEPGYVDEYETGLLKGYRISHGFEGCGRYNYYFILNPEKTLVVTRAHITELDPIIGSYKEYLKLPGVIPPEKEAQVFNQVLSTFKFRK